MSAEANAATARRVLDEVFNRGRLDLAAELYSADCVGHDPADPEDRRGVKAMQDKAQLYRDAMSDLELTVEDVFATGDRAVARWTARGTHDGDLAGIAPTGNRIETTGISIDRFDDDGRIVEEWDQWDNAGMLTQLGVSQAASTSA
jgi:steroid delta-isomerase-like uncharacterized protein